MITKITNHDELALARLIEQYKRSPNLKANVSAFAGQWQELEDVIHDMYLSRSYADSEGQQLDNIGGIVGVVRIPGESDVDYRVRIAQKIAANTGFGTPENIIQLVQFLTDSDVVELLEIFPAAVRVAIDGVVEDDLAESIFAIVKSLMPAGVRVGYLVQGADEDAFAFAGGTGLGFGDYFDDSVGGKFASIIGSDNSFDFGGEMPSKHTDVSFVAETTKSINTSVFGVNAQKCSVQVRDALTDFQVTDIDITSPDINTVLLTSAVAITKTFRVILLQAAD